MTDKVMILAAHPDDQVLGPGATIAKYNSDGIKVYSFVFSFGELAPIWIKPHLNKQRRKRESDKADQILGIEKTTYYGIPDTQIKQEIQTRHSKHKKASHIPSQRFDSNLKTPNKTKQR